MDEDSTWYTEVDLGPGHIGLDGVPALPQKGHSPPPIFSAHVYVHCGHDHPYPLLLSFCYCGQTAGCIMMPLSMEVGFSPGDFVLVGDPAILPKRGRSLQFSANIYSGQTAAWIKMPLSTEVGLGLRGIVLDGDPASPYLKGHS